MVAQVISRCIQYIFFFCGKLVYHMQFATHHVLITSIVVYAGRDSQSEVLSICQLHLLIPVD